MYAQNDGDEGDDNNGKGQKGSKKNWNLQQLTGKLLTAVFKDFLIFDDIFEFVQCYWTANDSSKYIIKYAKYQRQVSVVKYGYQKWPVIDGCIWNYHHLRAENIVNRPTAVRMTKQI